MKNTLKKIAPKKITTVDVLTDLFSKAKSVGIVDYAKMKVSQATELRRLIKQAGGQMTIAKNTLFKVASKKAYRPEGLNAFVFSLTDETSALKAVADYAKKNNILSFKAGLLGDKVLTGAEITTLANTPSKEISVSKILYLLNWNMSKLARTLDAVAKREVTN